MGNVAIVHSGGDTPASNSVLWGILAGLNRPNFIGNIYGYSQGWAGVLGGRCQVLKAYDHFGIHNESGIIIGSSRKNPTEKSKTGDYNVIEAVLTEFKKRDIDRVVTLSGDDGFKVSNACQKAGLKSVHVAKSIDDDLPETEITFGAWSARDLAAAVVRNLHATTKTHKMALVIQYMGRTSGKLTLYGGLASGCHIILIPEYPNWRLVDLCEKVKELHQRFGYVIIGINEELKQKELTERKNQIQGLIGEPPTDEFGHPLLSKEFVSYAEILANAIESGTGIESRAQILARICRSGPPSAYDVWLGTKMGMHAAGLLLLEESGRVVVVQNGKVTDIAMKEIRVGATRTVSYEEYRDWLTLAPVRFPDI